MALVPSLTEAAFSARRRPDWDRLDVLARGVQHRGLRALTLEQVSEVAPLYRDVCADLARAESARYSAPLVDYLQGLTAAAHAILYGSHAKGRILSRAASSARIRTALEAFPRAVRRCRGAMLLSALLFFGPLAFGLAAAIVDPGFAARVAPESMLRPLAEAYKEGFEAGRATGVDAFMAGFYVQHNVGIALTCFATGLAFGLGSAFYLVFNGLSTGAILGYVAAHGGGDNIGTFVIGHGSLELGAIVLCGGAGLTLGWSIVAPGPSTRVASLQRAAREIVVIVFGAAVMLLAAAAVEGFWSASSVPSTVKRAVGAVLFVLLASYVALAGRGSQEARALEQARESDRWI
jgi:uncharacterized membrane protein SpoIIM required for sporulation